MLREGRQDEEKEMSLTTKLKKEAEELEEIRETIEQLEKGLENPSKVRGISIDFSVNVRNFLATLNTEK